MLCPSQLLANAIRQANRVVQGVAHFPLEEPGKPQEGAQKWGMHLPLTSPVIKRFHPNYYNMHAEEHIDPHKPCLLGNKARCTVKMVQLRDWESMVRSIVLNHLDWFMSTMMEIIGSGEMNTDKVAEVQNLLSSSGIALNNISLIQARLLGNNATVHRETLLSQSMLGKFLRSHPLGLPELFGNKCGEALKVASDGNSSL